jgi:hypothetical protein
LRGHAVPPDLSQTDHRSWRPFGSPIDSSHSRPVTGPTVPFTRCQLIADRFQISARGGFSTEFAGAGSQPAAMLSLSAHLPITRPGRCVYSIQVGETGLEPATSAMSTQCSNQLSYPPDQALIITRRVGFVKQAAPELFTRDASGLFGLRGPYHFIPILGTLALSPAHEQGG